MNKKIGVAVVVMLVVGLGVFLYIDISGNGYSNYKEISQGTNPFVTDTDSDGISDYREIEVYDTNPTNSDTDGDGLNDYEEIKEYNTDPTDTDTLGNGLSDYEEVEKYDTDPLKYDTDYDQLNDYEEINEYNTDPTEVDTDNDNLTDSREIDISTDPTMADSDGDGLNDSVEINEYSTSPIKSDSDDDQLNDYEEINEYNTDPTATDTDGDNLSDHEEVKVHNTNASLVDTDSDGLSDYDEVTDYETDPTINDTDRDGLNDYEEIIVYDSDPFTNDTNGDGLTDLENIQHNLDPTSRDTSGDGFTDLYSVQNENINGSKRSILVQVSYMRGTYIPIQRMNQIEEEFSNSPVEDFDLKFIIDEQPVDNKETLTPTEYYTDYYNDDEVFDKRGKGYYHMMLVPDLDGSNVESQGQILGGTEISTDGMLVQEQNSQDSYTSTIAHELGHQLGLTKSLYTGIDSRSLSVSSYPSTLNYNWVSCIADGQCQDYKYKYTYSDGVGFNDWEYIKNNFKDHQPSKVNLRCSTQIICIA